MGLPRGHDSAMKVRNEDAHPRAAQRITDFAQFRRSVKSEKHDSAKPVPISIPQKDAIAIEPPKKVGLHISLAPCTALI